MKRRIKITATYGIEMEIDTSNPIVLDYNDEDELILDVAFYQFSAVLPVIESGGVVFKDPELIYFSKEKVDITNQQ